MRIATQKGQIGIALALLGLLGGAGFYLLQQNAVTTPGTEVTQNVSPAPKEHQVSIYWIETLDRGFRAVPRVFRAIDSESALGEALRQLLGDPPQGLYSGIPNGVELLNFSANDRDIFVNLSAAFREGGGSASMVSRTTQVLYTATSLNPDANVFLLIEGEPIGNLGGEGLEIKQPMTRKDFPLEF